MPGAQAISPYAVLVLLSAVLGAAAALLIKRLTATEAVATIVWYQALFATTLALPVCLLHWHAGWDRVLLLIAIGILGTPSWLIQTRAFFLIDASAVAIRVPAPAVRGLKVAHLWLAGGARAIGPGWVAL